MFLFTTPAATAQAPPAGTVIEAIRRGADQTGTDFGYLLNTAKRESALDPSAKAPTSSATGLFQFIEQTWLGLVKSEGPKLGLSDLAGAISPRGDGGYAVADSGARQAILKLREDPSLASLLAGTLTTQNRDALASATGRQPNAGELYMAHLLGARGASDLIRTAGTDPGRPAAQDLPEAASANRAIFYERGGRARSAGELYAMLAAPPAAGSNPPQAAPAGANAPASFTAPGLTGLFQTAGRTGPISEAVAKLWKVNNAPADGRPLASRFFPRAETEAETLPAEVETTASVAVATTPKTDVAAVPVPLPPARPRNLATQTGPRRP